MTSRTFAILRDEADPLTIVGAVAQQIQQAERTAAIPDPLRQLFNKGSAGRNWGEMPGDIQELTWEDSGEPLIRARFSWDEYRRGCHMGTHTYDVVVPDQLIAAWENLQRFWASVDFEADGLTGDEAEVWSSLLITHMAQRIVDLQNQYSG